MHVLCAFKGCLLLPKSSTFSFIESWSYNSCMIGITYSSRTSCINYLLSLVWKPMHHVHKFYVRLVLDVCSAWHPTFIKVSSLVYLAHTFNFISKPNLMERIKYTLMFWFSSCLQDVSHQILITFISMLCFSWLWYLNW